jgi:hypothetical protein
MKTRARRAERQSPSPARAQRAPRPGPRPRAAPRAPRCARLPVCLLEALRAGAAVEVAPKGAGWAITADGKVVARRKHQVAAEQLVTAAKEELARGAPAPALPPLEARRTVVITPQRPQGEAARYDLLEASSLIPSHRPADFRPDPMYPPGIQERAYHDQVAEQLKVRQGAQLLQPALLLSRTPSPLDGPPLVTEPPSAIVLGGNGRAMMLVLAYSAFPSSATSYREALMARAGDFGFSASEVQALKAPVLVRVIEGLTRTSPREALTSAVRRYNEGMTQALDPVTRAVAQAKTLSPELVQRMGALLAGGDSSLRELMRSEPAALLRLLEEARVVTAQNRSEWVDAGGGLTDGAKDLIEGMFLGLVLETAERVKATPPGLLAKIERAVPHLVGVASTLPEAFDLQPALRAAVDGLNEARSRGLVLADLAKQQDLLGDESGLEGLPLQVAQLLAESGPRQTGDAFRRWAAAVAHTPDQGLLFGRPQTPEEGLSALFAGRTPNPRKRDATVTCARCGGSGRVSPWAGSITWCEVCRGEGRIPAPMAEEPRQARLFNPGKKRDDFVTTVTTTQGLAGELVRRYGGVGFPSRVEVTTAGKRRLLLRFKGRDLVGLERSNTKGRKFRKDSELLEALRKDLGRRSPLM